MSNTIAEKGAHIEGEHRYRLWRAWDLTLSAKRLCYVMLNPSTADSSIDDPTIRRCVNLAKGLGFGRIDVVNLWTYRTKSPRKLKEAGYPNGPKADYHMRSVVAGADEVVFAWGAFPKKGSDRVRQVSSLVRSVGVYPCCFGRTKNGNPRHPLFLKRDALLEPISENWPPRIP